MPPDLWQAAGKRRRRDSAGRDMGRKLAAFRDRVGMAQDELAQLLRVRPRTLDSWERGRADPPAKYHKQIKWTLEQGERPLLANGGGQVGPPGPPEHAAAPAERQPAADVGTRSRATILVADDEAEMRQALTSLFGGIGHKLLAAADGVDVQQKAQRHRPDLIVLDVHMPGLDGFGALEALRANQYTRDIPVVMITVMERAEDQRRAQALGAWGYVSKLWDLGEVERRVEWVLDHRTPAAA